MSPMHAKGVDGSVEQVRQAVFDVADRRDCAEYEIGHVARFQAVLDPLQEGTQALYDAVKDGRYAFVARICRSWIRPASMRKRFHSTPCSNRSTRRIAAVSMWAGTMPETGATKIAERGSSATSRLEG
jgi:hypothetical protein